MTSTRSIHLLPHQISSQKLSLFLYKTLTPNSIRKYASCYFGPFFLAYWKSLYQLNVFVIFFCEPTNTIVPRTSFVLILSVLRISKTFHLVRHCQVFMSQSCSVLNCHTSCSLSQNCSVLSYYWSSSCCYTTGFYVEIIPSCYIPGLRISKSFRLFVLPLLFMSQNRFVLLSDTV